MNGQVKIYENMSLEDALFDFTGLQVAGEADMLRPPKESWWKRLWAWLRKEAAIGGK